MRASMASSLYHYKLRTLATSETSLHWVEVLGCIATTVTAARSHEPALALWSLSALATSLASLYLLRAHPAAFASPALREPWYAALRVHRAFAVVAMRRILKDPVHLGSRTYFAKALLVNSSVLPVLLQSLIFQLQAPTQAAVQVVAAAVAVRSMPEYCASLKRDGVPASDWEWLASMFGGLSTFVMAATASSRTDYAYRDVPCSLVMSYIIIIFELLLPVLFVHYYNRAVERWYISSTQRQGQQAQQQQHGLRRHPMAAPADAGSSGGGGGRSTVPAPAHQREKLHMGPYVMAFLSAGVCAALWDIAVTIYMRWLRE